LLQSQSQSQNPHNLLQLSQAKESPPSLFMSTMCVPIDFLCLGILLIWIQQAAEDNEIDLAEGEIIKSIEEVGEGWWSGVKSNGKSGLFPCSYLQTGYPRRPLIPIYMTSELCGAY
jgi:Variant SH3 domain